jgi:signal transduction histidine kinase
MAEGAMPGPLFTTVLVTALVLTVVVGPVQARLEAQLDRLFFRNRYHYRHVLGRVPDGLALLGTSAQAAEHVLSSVGEAMELRRIAVALRPEEGRVRAWSRVRSPGGSPEEGAAVRTPAEPGVWACLEAADGPHLADPGATGTPLDHWLLAEGLELALPLRTPEALVGVLAISAPSGGRLFSGEDIEILRTVAASLALALSHALAFETIREMNEELEARIERRTAELEKVRLQLYQWEKMASLGVLAAGVAHELNTPLGVVLSAVEQIQDQVQAGGPHDETTVRLVQLGVEAARRASQIVGDLRSYSRPETSEVQSLDVRECIHSTLRLLGPSLRHQQIEVALELGEIPTIEGFPALFNQTLTNLVMNAAAAIRRQGTIWIRARVVPQKRVRVEVEDSGPGIPAEMRSRIFEPFFTTKPPGEGTGLGLSLCYTFIEQHGGRIWEEGEPGRGARFVVELPFKLAPEQRARVRASYRLAPGPRGP